MNEKNKIKTKKKKQTAKCQTKLHTRYRTEKIQRKNKKHNVN